MYFRHLQMISYQVGVGGGAPLQGFCKSPREAGGRDIHQQEAAAAEEGTPPKI